MKKPIIILNPMYLLIEPEYGLIDGWYTTYKDAENQLIALNQIGNKDLHDWFILQPAGNFAFNLGSHAIAEWRERTKEYLRKEHLRKNGGKQA